MQPTEQSASTPAPVVAPAAPVAPTRRCENCGAALYGEHCFACGQPAKGLVRHFSSIMGDFLDTVFNIDSRVLRTIGPLLFRPGYLSLEYFAGRRVRYVTPMRLFLFLSLAAFFAVHGSIEFNEDGADKPGGIHVGAPQQDSFDKAQTPEEVRRTSAQVMAELDKARESAKDVPAATMGIDIARQKLKEKAEERLAWLAERDKARAAGKPLPPEPADDRKKAIRFPVNGKDWDPNSNPVDFVWLPAPVNRSLNKRMSHARDVLQSSKSEKTLVDALFNVLPQTLMLLMPIFALMLKLAYWFKRRLYMEHLIVALHSHAFMALGVTVIMGLSWLIGVAPEGGFWDGALHWLRGLSIAWIPIYLLLMQKRVYGQGWLMTLAKYGVLGICYSVLLGFGLVGAMLVGLLTL